MKNLLAQIRNADVYLNGTRVLSAINWSMRQDENWAVVGNNGAGKTTFLKLVFGEVIPVHGGEVHWFGRREPQPIWEVREKIGFVSAEYQAGYDHNISAWEVVASGLFSSIGLYAKVSASQKRTALKWMDFLGIQHLADTGFRRMSYGEARRVLLARALVHSPSLLILDEPCAGLDIPSREVFLEALGKLSKTRVRLIYVTHRIDELLPAITHVVFLKRGKIFAQGKKEDMLRDEMISEVLECRIKLRENDGRYWITESRIPKTGLKS